MHTAAKFRNGDAISFKKDKYDMVDHIYHVIAETRPDVRFKRGTFMRAILYVYNTGCDIDSFLNRIRKHPDMLYYCGNVTTAKEMLVNVYNYKRRAENRI